MYFVAEGARYWLVIGPGGYLLYRKEGSRTRYMGRRTLEEVRRLLAAADPRTLAAVADLLKPQPSAAEAQVSRREAEEALEELRRELARAVRRWGSEGGGGPWGPDPGRLREKVAEFLEENMRLVERILPHRDLRDRLADAVEEETYGYRQIRRPGDPGADGPRPRSERRRPSGRIGLRPIGRRRGSGWGPGGVRPGTAHRRR